MFNDEEKKMSLRRINHILDFIETIEVLTKGLDLSELLEDLTTYLAMERLLQNIGEASYQISGSVREQASEIPWSDIIGMRHVLVHGYEVVDETVLHKTIETDIYELRAKLLKLKERLEKDG